MTNPETAAPGWLKKILILIPIMIGTGVFFYMSTTKKPPGQKTNASRAPVARVMTITPMDLLPRAFGNGTAEPVRVWKAIAQVSGKIVFTHPQLQKGKVVKKDTALVRIDPSEYKIAISQLKTRIQSFKIQLEEQQVQEKNNQQLLKIQEKTLAIKQKELARLKNLYERQILSVNDYETQLQGLIAQQAQVQSIQNSLNLAPYQRNQLIAQMEQAEGDLANAELQLSYTEMKAPFDIQIAAVNNKSSEFVQKGQTIFEGNDISAVEIEAQFVPGSARPVFLSLQDRFKGLDVNTPSLDAHLGTTALVRIPGDNFGDLVWPAQLNRFSDTIDTETRTMGLIFIVKNELGNNQKPRQRPLFNGLYCEVELRGKMIRNALVIPRSSVHPNNTVYLITADNKLEIRTIQPAFTLENVVMVEQGIKAGETLILSDVIPAVSGMVIDPVKDTETLGKLMLEAKGAQP